jgi:hypothetical protein
VREREFAGASLAGDDRRLEARQAVRAVGVLEQETPQRGQGEHRRHLLALDQPRELAHVALAALLGQHQRAAGGEGPEDPGHRAVEGKGRKQQVAPWMAAVEGLARGGRVHQVRVEHLDPLGPAGRPGGVDHVGQVARPGAAVGLARPAGALAPEQQRGRPVGRQALGRGGLCDDDRGRGIGQQECQALGGIGGIEGHVARAGLEDPEQPHQHLVRALGAQRDPLPRARSHTLELARQGPGAPHEVAVAQRPAAVADRRGVRARGGLGPDELLDRAGSRRQRRPVGAEARGQGLGGERGVQQVELLHRELGPARQGGERMGELGGDPPGVLGGDALRVALEHELEPGRGAREAEPQDGRREPRAAGEDADGQGSGAVDAALFGREADRQRGLARRAFDGPLPGEARLLARELGPARRNTAGELGAGLGRAQVDPQRQLALEDAQRARELGGRAPVAGHPEPALLAERAAPQEHQPGRQGQVLGRDAEPARGALELVREQSGELAALGIRAVGAALGAGERQIHRRARREARAAPGSRIAPLELLVKPLREVGVLQRLLRRGLCAAAIGHDLDQERLERRAVEPAGRRLEQERPALAAEVDPGRGEQRRPRVAPALAAAVQEPQELALALRRRSPARVDLGPGERAPRLDHLHRQGHAAQALEARAQDLVPRERALERRAQVCGPERAVERGAEGRPVGPGAVALDVAPQAALLGGEPVAVDHVAACYARAGSTASVIATTTSRGPVYGSRAWATLMLSSRSTSPLRQGKTTRSAA